MRVLIVEDEIKTAAYLSKGLKENGFVADVAHNGQDGLFLATNNRYDLIILDVMLPKIDGWSLITCIRGMGKEIPILFLSAYDEIHNRVKGLELGADDYLVKPFAFSELLARVKTILRRGPGRSSENITICDLKIDVLRHKVTRNHQKIELTQQEFSLLSLLARHKGEILTRTFIAEQVWDMNFDSDTNIVDVAVRRLRRKIDDGFEEKLIRTVRGVGYVLEEN